jgi:integrase
VEFAHVTGWRTSSEILPLEWRQVDMKAGEVRLDAGSTKNGEGRVFPFTAELRRVLEDQQEAAELLKKAGVISVLLHEREEDGQADHRVRVQQGVAEGAGRGRLPGTNPARLSSDRGQQSRAGWGARARALQHRQPRRPARRGGSTRTLPAWLLDLAEDSSTHRSPQPQTTLATARLGARWVALPPQRDLSARSGRNAAIFRSPLSVVR